MTGKQFWPRVAPEGEYSDLYWLRGWGERIEAWLNDEEDGGVWKPSRLSGFIFRPDEHARDALLLFGSRHAEVVGQVREFLDHADFAFVDFCRLLTPDTCPECQKHGYLGADEYEADILFCEWCGASMEWKAPRTEAVEAAKYELAVACDHLQRVVFVAADAIEAAEPGTKAAKTRNDEPTEEKMQDLRTAIENRGRTASPTTIGNWLSNKGMGMNRQIMFAGLRFLHQRGEYDGFKRPPKKS